MNTNKQLPYGWKFRWPEKIQIIDVRSVNELKQYAEDWNDLLIKSAASSHMSSYPWISAYLKAILHPHAKNWLCLFAYDGKQLIGVLPLIINRKFSIGRWSIILFETPFDIFHTSSVDCLTLKGHEDTIELFIDYLHHIPHVLPLVGIKQIPGHSSSMIYSRQNRGKIIIVSQKSGFENFITISGTYDSYMKKLSSKFKKELRRRSRRLNELKNIRFLPCENKRPVDENIKRLIEIEGKGWKKRTKTCMSARPGDTALHILGIKGLDRCGLMEWDFLEAGEKTIAVYSASRINRIIYGMKSGFDEEYAFYTPGNLLFQHMVQHAFESGDVDEINCMSDMPWQKRWKMNRRQLFDLLIFPHIPVLSGLLALLLKIRQVFKKTSLAFFLTLTPMIRMMMKKTNWGHKK